MSSGECEISDMLLGRAKAWQGFCILASRFFGEEGELSRLGRRLRGGSLPRLGS